VLLNFETLVRRGEDGFTWVLGDKHGGAVKVTGCSIGLVVLPKT
jgi:hypothetical protein